jgi:hypothetical protein
VAIVKGVAWPHHTANPDHGSRVTLNQASASSVLDDDREFQEKPIRELRFGQTVQLMVMLERSIHPLAALSIAKQRQ